MKSIFLALALIATGVHAAEDTDSTPCDGSRKRQANPGMRHLQQNHRRTIAQGQLPGPAGTHAFAYGSNKTQLADITASLKTAQQKWRKLRDADCAVDTFPAMTGSKAYTIAQNDCLARMSDERSEFLESIGQE